MAFGREKKEEIKGFISSEGEKSGEMLPRKWGESTCAVRKGKKEKK